MEGRYFGPGLTMPSNTRDASDVWRLTVSDAQFTILMEEALKEVLISMPRSPDRPGFLRLTRVINASCSLPDDIAAGKRDFGDCWSVNWGGKNKPSAGHYSASPRDDQLEYFITADVDENAVDWQMTLGIVIGWANFENEVRLIRNSEVEVILLEDFDGNNLLLSNSQFSPA